MTRGRFPFGIQPDASDPSHDERGPDTVNRLLLHGARYHDRKSVFVSDLGEVPDWRADRLSIRVALALAEDHGIGPGDVVALALPLSVDFALVERAVWALGAATAISPSSSSAKAVVALESDSKALLERGGALDTPERASRLRGLARSVPPETIASIEPSGPLSHRDWVEAIESFLARYPAERGLRTVLSMSEPFVPARAALYAGWADGLTEIELGPSDRGGGTSCRRFANLADLKSGGVHG